MRNRPQQIVLLDEITETLLVALEKANTWEDGAVTDHRQLVSIRQTILAHLGLPSDKDRWMKV